MFVTPLFVHSLYMVIIITINPLPFALKKTVCIVSKTSLSIIR